MVTTARIVSAAKKIDPSYLTGGANVHFRLIQVSFCPRESTIRGRLNRFIRFVSHSLTKQKQAQHFKTCGNSPYLVRMLRRALKSQ